jgi:signal transduction histidine kinase
MILIRRRLFWKIYLTLVASLFSVAMLMGGLFWAMGGESLRERRGAFVIRLADQLPPDHGDPADAIAEAIKRLGDRSDADISVYAADGAFIASLGQPIALPGGGDAVDPRSPRITRMDLGDGRMVLARLRMPPPPPGLRILMVMVVVAGCVGLAAFPVTARLTRRLERLRSGVATWGAGSLAIRVDETGSDEVALVARTFNAAAERVEALLAAQKALLANASHELRSPLARLRMAIEIWSDDPAAGTRSEIVRNLAEIDQLVEEILLASRLDHHDSDIRFHTRVDLLGLAAEEAARVDASAAGASVEIDGDARLLRRLIRNLLENSAKHGRPPIEVAVTREADMARIAVSDHGAGIAAADRERVFEPFYRPSGHGEAAGGWGLGLSLVRQIALRHGGRAACEAGSGTGSRFVVEMPIGGRPAAQSASAED